MNEQTIEFVRKRLEFIDGKQAWNELKESVLYRYISLLVADYP